MPVEVTLPLPIVIIVVRVPPDVPLNVIDAQDNEPDPIAKVLAVVPLLGRLSVRIPVSVTTTFVPSATEVVFPDIVNDAASTLPVIFACPPPVFETVTAPPVVKAPIFCVAVPAIVTPPVVPVIFVLSLVLFTRFAFKVNE